MNAILMTALGAVTTSPDEADQSFVVVALISCFGLALSLSLVALGAEAVWV
jgi:hypothetical protein